MSMVGATMLLLHLVQVPPPVDSLERDRVVGVLGDRLDAQLTRFAAYGFAGSVLVARGGEVVLLKGYGLADVERGVPNSAATRFEMNSMTKMFTGVAILQLAAQGRVQLSDPMSRYFPGFPPAKQQATIEQLATHTAGLIVEGAQLASDSRDAFVRDVARTPVESPPGERYRYTNAGFSLLAALIETVSGETYEQYLRRHLFEPAAMHSALFRNEVPAGDSRFAHGYVGTPRGLHPGPPNPYVWGTIGAGGVWSTVGDMYRWVVALRERRVLEEAEWRTLASPPQPPAMEAFGWHVETTPDGGGRARISKGGGSDDFASQLLYYPRDAVVIVWASNNLRQRWRQTLNQALPALVFADNAILLPPVVPITPAQLRELRGRYVSGTDTLDINAGAGYLYAATNRLDVSTTVMFFPQDNSHFTGFDPAGRALTRLEFNRAGSRSLSIELTNGRRLSLQR
jgi:CubicO group peptidase (beta-lactamase class C family)